MTKIFIGLFFLFCNFSIGGLNLLPAFVGYILIFFGLDEEYECPSLSASRTICVGAAVMGGALWVAALLGYGMTMPVGLFLQLLVTYRLVLWAQEQSRFHDWEPRRLRLSWYALTGASVAAALLKFVSPGMGFVWTVTSLGCAVWYIWEFYKLRRSARVDDEETL